MMKYTSGLLFILIFYTSCNEQNETSLQKDSTDSGINFSGEWKSQESISMGGNIVCTYNGGDRMLSKIMKIEQQADFLTVEVPNLSPGAALGTSQEKLTFDGKQSEINHSPERGKKFTVELSADGKTMTVNSIVHLVAVVPFTTNTQKQQFVYVTEVWKLSDDGNTISVQANAKATLFDEERSWKTVFYKVGTQKPFEFPDPSPEKIDRDSLMVK
ncbi:hypothetical protein [Chryseolinea lacunae]|uniref:Lipocalin-like domain-containing protein n=1 Tax=Chryseolinea lacunae TaxID=2801331 RepID=A0ABS1KT40_9BACT|nr:hypothetical protein [Chryseolinea lacunae]MBL0742638.1 hypothetical protein [Chryseolinea lacunae]